VPGRTGDAATWVSHKFAVEALPAVVKKPAAGSRPARLEEIIPFDKHEFRDF